MIGPRIQSSRSRKRGGKKIWLALPALLIVGFLATRYAGDAWFAARQRFLPQNLQLLDVRSQHVQENLNHRRIQTPEGFAPGYSNASDLDSIAGYIRDSRRILTFYEGSGENPAAIYGYEALFSFYEILLYVQLDTSTLIGLAGRSYLPPSPGKKPEDLRRIARQTSISARKSLAIDPENPMGPVLYLALTYGDLLQTERTDPALFDLFQKIDREKLPEAFLPVWSWAALALNSMKGDPAGLNEAVAEKIKLEGKTIRPDAPSLELLRVYTLFHAKDFIQALSLSQRLQADPALPIHLRVEGARMSGEIFARQNGPAFGLPYFLEAKRLSDSKDPFIEERIRELQAGKP